MRTDDDPIADDDATSTSSESDGVFEAEPTAPDPAFEPYSEVLSGVMDEHDSDSTGELELPGMNDDLKPQPAESDPGFDGWLDDDQVVSSGDDPYSALADEDDDAAAEIADWVAFTSATGDEPADTGETDVVVDVTDDSIAAASVATDGRTTPEPDESTSADEGHDVADEEPHEDTIEFFLDEPEEDDLDEEAAVAPEDAEESEDEPAEEPKGEPEDGLDDEPSEEPVVVSTAPQAAESGVVSPCRSRGLLESNQGRHTAGEGREK